MTYGPRNPVDDGGGGWPGLWAWEMPNDPRVWLAWNWFNVDAQGRKEIANEQERSWKRMQEIEVESTNRRAGTGGGHGLDPRFPDRLRARPEGTDAAAVLSRW